MRIRSIVWVVAGCSGTDTPHLPSPATFIEAAEVEGLEILPSVGVAPHPAVVRAVNRFEAAVPSAPTDTLTVDGVPVTATFDGFGYAGILLETAGTRIIEGAGEPAEFHTVVTDWPGLTLQRAWFAPVDAVDLGAAITTGGVIVSGSDVWWAGEGTVPHRVLSAEEPIVGIRTGNIDVDGVSDAIVWTTTTVYLLRGRSGGGLGWGGALTASGYQVGGADVGDLSADNLPDLAIAWIGPDGSGTLDIWEGDGLFAFSAAEPRDIPGRPISLVIGDNTGEGLNQVTVLHSEGDWSRFVWGAPRQYMPIGPITPVAKLVLPPDATLARSGDVNKDDGEELSIGSLRAEGIGRNFWFVDVKTDAVQCADGDADAQCTTTYLPLENEAGAWLAMGDGNGDYVTDIFLAHDTRVLYAVVWDPLKIDGEYTKVNVMDLPAYGPIDTTDFDRDGELDLFLAGGPIWWRYLGQGSSDIDVFWQPRSPGSTDVRETLDGPFGFVELDGNLDTQEIVGFTSDAGQTHFKVVQHTKGEGRAPLLSDFVIANGAVPTDLAICDSDVYVAVDGDVLRIAMRDPEQPDLIRPQIAATVEGTATRIDCGTGPSDTQLAVLDAGRITFRRKATLLDIGPGVDATGAVDVALGDLGAGPEAKTCTTAGCSIVFWPYGAAGEAVFAKGDPASIVVVNATGAERTLDGWGTVSVGDLDGDGNVDLLSLAEGLSSLVTVHRSTGQGIAPAELFHSLDGWTGALQVQDGDGDGWGDLWAIDAVRDLVHTVSPIPPVTVPSSETGSTGDTGGS